MKRIRKLYVQETTYQQLWYMWNVKPNANWEGKKLFIQCSKNTGFVKWDKAIVYLEDELINRNYKIIT